MVPTCGTAHFKTKIKIVIFLQAECSTKANNHQTNVTVFRDWWSHFSWFFLALCPNIVCSIWCTQVPGQVYRYTYIQAVCAGSQVEQWCVDCSPTVDLRQATRCYTRRQATGFYYWLLQQLYRLLRQATRFFTRLLLQASTTSFYYRLLCQAIWVGYYIKLIYT